MLTLFQVVAGLDWVAVMRDLRVDGAQCTESTSSLRASLALDSDVPADCGSPTWSLLYFFSFFIFTFTIFLNLYIATILDTYASSSGRDKWNLSLEDFERYKTVWQDFDPQSQGAVALGSLPEFLRQLGPPLCPEDPREMVEVEVEARRVSKQVKLKTGAVVVQAGVRTRLRRSSPTPTKCVAFLQLLRILAAHQIDEDALDFEERQERMAVASRLKRVSAAVALQRAFRRWRERRKKPDVLHAIQQQAATVWK